MRPRLAYVAALLALACDTGGGSGGAVARDSLTQRQRDSILAQSSIPGAAGVGAAMRAADSTSARIQATDTIAP